MKKNRNCKSILIMLLVLINVLWTGCGKQTTLEDSDFTVFMQSNSDFFVLARQIIPWKEVPQDSSMEYRHKIMDDGREYAEIKVVFSAQDEMTIQPHIEAEIKHFEQVYMGKSPYFCIPEGTFRIDETDFQCYSFAVSESLQTPSVFYCVAFGYNTAENACIYLLYTDEYLSFCEPYDLLKEVYP